MIRCFFEHKKTIFHKHFCIFSVNILFLQAFLYQLVNGHLRVCVCTSIVFIFGNFPVSFFLTFSTLPSPLPFAYHHHQQSASPAARAALNARSLPTPLSCSRRAYYHSPSVTAIAISAASTNARIHGSRVSPPDTARGRHRSHTA